jgi:hypothetical protein
MMTCSPASDRHGAPPRTDEGAGADADGNFFLFLASSIVYLYFFPVIESTSTLSLIGVAFPGSSRSYIFADVNQRF